MKRCNLFSYEMLSDGDSVYCNNVFFEQSFLDVEVALKELAKKGIIEDRSCSDDNTIELINKYSGQPVGNLERSN